jgi:hypothetical protein
VKGNRRPGVPVKKESPRRDDEGAGQMWPASKLKSAHAGEAPRMSVLRGEATPRHKTTSASGLQILLQKVVEKSTNHSLEAGESIPFNH